MQPDNNDGRWAKRYATFLRLTIQTVSAILGLYIMYTAIKQGSDRPWLYTAAIMMMGVPFAHTLESMVSFMSDLKATMKAMRAKQNERDQ